MGKRVFLVPEPSKVELLRLKEMLNTSRAIYAGGLMKKRAGVADWQSALGPGRTWLYDELECVSTSVNASVDDSVYHAFLKSIMADCRSFYLIERTYRTGVGKSVFNITVRLENICFNALSVLVDAKPDAIIFHSPPHKLVTWILGKAGEFLDIPVYTVRLSPLPWRAWARRGLEEQIVFGPATRVDSISQRTEEYIASNRQDYSAAMPSYEKEKLKSSYGKNWSWRAEFKQLARERRSIAAVMDNLRALRIKRNLYSKYSSESTILPAQGNIVSFFLHFQPERTSLPDGYEFAQQWLAIRAISLALPEGWLLCVKEHPSIFRRPFNAGIRDIEFYQAIAALPNVRLLLLETDTFEIIDRSRVVATITGTVGFQALCRGVPVLVFGVADYKEAPGVSEFRKIESLDRYFEALGESHCKVASALDEKYLRNVEAFSFASTLSGVSDFFQMDQKYSAELEVLKFLLSEEGDCFA